ncbi:hypothetical protein VTL71DRAFT_7439 [Oculimacula yallundae]|uniref:2EXR domain-containing protein n=1 Tax=Oculimacula yallundae TaxID=86028 RepID=A0ABR4BU69_9HELO
MEDLVSPPPITGASSAEAVFADMAKLSLEAEQAERLKKITFRDVSAAAQHHINAASVEINDDPHHLEMASRRKAAADTEKLHEFHLFPKLAAELRSKIWSFYALMSPRAIDVSSYGQRFPIFYGKCALNLQQINKETRADTYIIHGYVKLQHPTISSLTYLFNPAIDILLLSHFDTNATGFGTPSTTSLSACLSASKVLDKVRTIALDISSHDDKAWMTSLRSYTSLEVLFIIMGERFVHGNTELGRPSSKLHVIEEGTTLMAYYGIGGGFAEKKRKLEDLLAGGKAKGKCPKVVMSIYVHINHRHPKWGVNQ